MQSQQTTQETVSATTLSFPQRLLVSNIPDDASYQFLWLALRLVGGGLMIHNGFDKLADVQGFAESVVSFMGLPFPIFFTYCAGYAEIISPIFIMLGLLTRLNAVVLVATMGAAIFFHLKAGGLSATSIEAASLYAILYTVFLISGSGQWSLDALIAKKFN
ncbi:MAG: DoxX family protein [Symploca sp. SIO2G7]|nr:DoxX family protein [Symploca sp. SIO2G7]